MLCHELVELKLLVSSVRVAEQQQRIEKVPCFVVLSHVEKTTVTHVRTTSRKIHQDDLEEDTIEKKSVNHEEGWSTQD